VAFDRDFFGPTTRVTISGRVMILSSQPDGRTETKKILDGGYLVTMYLYPQSSGTLSSVLRKIDVVHHNFIAETASTLIGELVSVRDFRHFRRHLEPDPTRGITRIAFFRADSKDADK
jgi:hypothetical protein